VDPLQLGVPLIQTSGYATDADKGMHPVTAFPSIARWR